jgi:hypothetical protein
MKELECVTIETRRQAYYPEQMAMIKAAHAKWMKEQRANDRRQQARQYNKIRRFFVGDSSIHLPGHYIYISKGCYIIYNIMVNRKEEVMEYFGIR